MSISSDVTRETLEDFSDFLVGVSLIYLCPEANPVGRRRAWLFQTVCLSMKFMLYVLEIFGKYILFRCPVSSIITFPCNKQDNGNLS